MNTSPITSWEGAEAYFTFADSPVKVRNTFVHFDSASADQRAVQSMPHGML